LVRFLWKETGKNIINNL